MDFTSSQNQLAAQVLSALPFPRPVGLGAHRYADREIAPLVLSQNVPNPHEGETVIPFTLLYAADVRLEIFDLLGRKMAAVVRKGLSSGEHSIQLNLRGLCLPEGDYPYQLQVTSAYGVQCLSRVMTLALDPVE